MTGCLPTQALAFLGILAVFVYATHATQAIAFGWKPGLSYVVLSAASSFIFDNHVYSTVHFLRLV